ncbi:hypothetical protein [Streptomyces sp. NPDC093589]|uniref:hypothetical protein n=1 Tax=Streptomyces sp. NPDC093589 TaxID=3366043 RepID=UPI00382BE8F0
MARIRTVKPEMFESESLAECSVTAMLTFIGLLTQADDSGRHRDHPAIIAGRLWALRPEHTATHVARDLEELAASGLVCRYTGCDGRTWLHIVTWDQHQKINKSTPSRFPRCPAHQGGNPCGKCQEATCPTAHPQTDPSASRTPTGADREDSGSAPGGVQRPVSPSTAPVQAPAGPDLAPAADVAAPVEDHGGDTAASLDETAGQRVLLEGSGSATGGVQEDSCPGSRILDPGSVPTGRKTPAPNAASETVSAKQLVAEYAADSHRRPPNSTLGHLGREVKNLLAEDFEPDAIRTALARLRQKGLHPSVLPSLVNEVVNASPRQSASAPSSASGAGPWASTGSAYAPYLNPTTPEPTTFGGRL